MSFESRKTKIGRVVTDGMDKTVVVAVDRRRRHPLYKKSIGVRKKYVVHDAKNQAHVGDLISLIETRPMSKTKRWKLLDIIEKVDLAEITPEDIQLAVDVQKAQKVALKPTAEVAEEEPTAEVAEEEPAAEVVEEEPAAEVVEEEPAAEVAEEEPAAEVAEEEPAAEDKKE
jgi:small subunit ribosomal protein S17